MNKETYLRFLRAYLTNRLPAGEVEDIMNYYTEYFEDAGEGREQAVMTELGSPERLAQQILGERQREELVPAETADYGHKETYSAPSYVPANRGGMPGWMFVLILIVAAVFAGPVLASLIFGLGLAGVLCIAIGLGVSVSGIGRLSLAGLLFRTGGGLITVAVGIVLLLGAALVVWLTVKLIRWFRDSFVERRAGYEAEY